MGGGSSKKEKNSTPPPQPGQQPHNNTNTLNGIVPEDTDEPTLAELKAVEEANALQRQTRNKQPPSSSSSSSSKARQAQEATDLTDEFAASTPFQFNFKAVKELGCHAAHGGQGRSLVELKDTVASLTSHFNQMYAQYTTNQQTGMSVQDFVTYVTASKLDLDENAIKSNFFEATSYPDDEDDAEQVARITANEGQFAAAVVRIANAYVMQEQGESEKGLHEMLMDFLVQFGANVGLQCTPEELTDSIKLRDVSFFQPPKEFMGTSPRVYLLLAWGDGKEGKVVISLNATKNPKCSYNFLCLCTGEKGVGEITGLTLHLKGIAFHRCIKGMCLQGGDIEGADGYGGESIYGGEFEDESFENGLSHDQAGVVSMGNSGVNTNTSQFFITLGECTHLDGENNAFGKVVEGMNYVLDIGNGTETDDDDKPLQAVVVKDCGVVS